MGKKMTGRENQSEEATIEQVAMTVPYRATLTLMCTLELESLARDRQELRIRRLEGWFRRAVKDFPGLVSTGMDLHLAPTRGDV